MVVWIFILETFELLECMKIGRGLVCQDKALCSSTSQDEQIVVESTYMTTICVKNREIYHYSKYMWSEHLKIDVKTDLFGHNMGTLEKEVKSYTFEKVSGSS